MGHPLLPDCRAPSMSDMWGGILGASTLSLVLSFPLMTPYPLSLMCQDAVSQLLFFLEGKRVPLNPIILSAHRGKQGRENLPAVDSMNLGGRGPNPGSVTSCLYDLGGPVSSLSLSFLS